jgi:hypothetical protein
LKARIEPTTIQAPPYNPVNKFCNVTDVFAIYMRYKPLYAPTDGGIWLVEASVFDGDSSGDFWLANMAVHGEKRHILRLAIIDLAAAAACLWVISWMIPMAGKWPFMVKRGISSDRLLPL